MSVCGLLLFLTVTSLSFNQGQGDSITYKDFQGKPIKVTSDERSFMLNGKRVLFLSGSFHYPRATPGMWPSIFDQMVEDGLNMVETYVFWNLHEFKKGQPYNFEGIANVTYFLQLAAEKNLFVNFRFGPYVCGEWNYGGLPVWLNGISGMAPRTHSPEWESEMERFLKDMVKVVEPYLAGNGGPIVLAQIENEYHYKDPEYIKWCGDLARSLNVGIPWIMCNGDSAEGTINTCNGNDCATYADRHGKNYPGQPLAWTENEGWFQSWDPNKRVARVEDRSPQDMAYVILRWFARGGCHHNYYMWYGGSNFASWMGSSVAQMYADGVNLHSDGQPNEPKRSHLKRLHKVLMSISQFILNCPIQANNPHKLNVVNSTGSNLPVSYNYTDHVFGLQVIFMENNDTVGYHVLLYSVQKFYLPPLSVILVDVSGLVVFNSTDVQGNNFSRCFDQTKALDDAKWMSWVETMSIPSTAVEADKPLEQLSITQDESDYLFYSTSVSGIQPGNLTMDMSVFEAGVFMVFLDSVYLGEVSNRSHNSEFTTTAPVAVSLPVSRALGKITQLTILSVSLGIPNNGPAGELAEKGIADVPRFTSGSVEMGKWYHKAKLSGEDLKVFEPSSSPAVKWTDAVPTGKALTWYKTEFKTPPVVPGKTLLLNMASMSRGHIYINGFDLGRYWLVETNGTIVQQYYFIPRDLLMSGESMNLLVILDENGQGKPKEISLLYSSIQTAC